LGEKTMPPKRKGIILAGGHGSRLYPMTSVVSKQLLAVYNKPMIYYPLTLLMLAGIRDILVITLPRDLNRYQALLGDGSRWGVRFSYIEQPEPNGLAAAFILGESFLDGHPSALVLGDNIFYGDSLTSRLQAISAREEGATIFAYPVKHPQHYGVVSFDDSGKALAIEEKPKNPASTYAVPGLYFYDASVVARAKKLTPSTRGEIEISELNQSYLDQGQLFVDRLHRGVAWFDGGTPSTLLKTSLFIEAIEERQGILIGSPEEVAYRLGYIDAQQLAVLAKPLLQSSYGQRLIDVMETR
jgi:glucose-1-phosphate thymidylyltransferase